jgi:hypothetical protein
MTAAEWLSAEIEAGRVPATPPDEALSLAADVLGLPACEMTKAPGGLPSAFVSVEGGRASATSNTA